MKRGIYVVANRASQTECLNLVRSIRSAGCMLPVCLVPFGGVAVDDSALLELVSLREISMFPVETAEFLSALHQVFPTVLEGSLARFAAWFGEWDEFIYSDNDVVALTNWEHLFLDQPPCDLLHADEEYKTGGKFNFSDPQTARRLLGDAAIDHAMTSGHFLCRRKPEMIAHLWETVEWFRLHGGCTLMHDQVFLLVAAIRHHWSLLNLCQPPSNWLSSWAGDYETTLQLLQKVTAGGKIAHLHYSGGSSRLLSPIEELTTSFLSRRERLWRLFLAALGHGSGWFWLQRLPAKIKRRLGF